MDIVITTNGDGFLAKSQSIQGGFAEWDTPYEALYNLFDVLNLIAEYRNSSFKKDAFAKGIKFHIPEFA